MQNQFVSVENVSESQCQKLFDKVTPFLDRGWTLVNGSVQFVRTHTGFADRPLGTWLCLISKETKGSNLNDDDFSFVGH